MNRVGQGHRFNRFTLLDDIQGGFVETTMPATINTEKGIVHGLGYVPNGYIVVSQDKAGSIYEGSNPWTKDVIYLQSNASSIAVRLFVF